MVVYNRNLSLSEGAVTPWMRGGVSNSWYLSLLEGVAREHGFSVKTPVKELNQDHIDLVLYGNRSKESNDTAQVPQRPSLHLGHHLRGRDSQTCSAATGTPSPTTPARKSNGTLAARACKSCGGKRLRPEALAVTVCGLGIMDVCSKNIGDALNGCGR